MSAVIVRTTLIWLVLFIRVLCCHSTIFQTNGSTLHFWLETVNCPDGEPCSIYCDTTYGGPGVCEGATFNCPTNAQCDLFCGPHSFACREATINCSLSADCNVYCSGTGGQNICNGLNPTWSPNGQNILTCEGANGHNMCSNIHGFPVPPSDEPMVLNCDGDFKCQGSDIICPSNADCTINCLANSACKNAVITWSINGDNTLNCDATKTDSCLNVPTPPTNNPTAPSMIPSAHPSFNPTHLPSNNPSFNPTHFPSINPSFNPTAAPSSINPSFNPTHAPLIDLTDNPTALSINPTDNPSIQTETTSFSAESGNDSVTHQPDMLLYFMVALVAILAVISIRVVVYLLSVFKKGKKAEQTAIHCMSKQQTNDTVETGQQATNTTKQTDLQMISTVSDVTSGHEASISIEDQREGVKAMDHDEMYAGTGDESTSHDSLYAEVVCERGQTKGGDTAGACTAGGGTPGMICTDCGLLKAGKVFESNGNFYCNDCWLCYN
eukprot:333995_1